MNDFWFVLYHTYTTSTKYDKQALKFFEKDIKYAQEIGIKALIVEDYFDKFLFGEYTSFWNEKTFTQMIKITHDYGIKFIPYANATELSINSESYKKYGKKWGTKNRWGKIYSGFNSIFLPEYYPDPKFAFFGKVMCPITGWRTNIEKQVEYFFDNFEIDGIYFDRVDYRVKCFDHSDDKDHFKKGIPILINNINKIAKNKGKSNLSIINDSCMVPDETLIKCMESVDMVLSELLPIDWNPYSLYNKLNLYFGDIAWKLRKVLLPLTRFIVKQQFQSTKMTNFNRISTIVERLKKHKSPDNIILFSHRKDKRGLKTIKKVVTSNKCKQCYFIGLKRLTSIKGWNL